MENRRIEYMIELGLITRDKTHIRDDCVCLVAILLESRHLDVYIIQRLLVGGIMGRRKLFMCALATSYTDLFVTWLVFEP